MFGIKRRKQSLQADNRMKESGSAAVLELKCAVAVMPSGDATDGSAEYKDKGVVTVTDDDRLVLQTKRETMEFHLKDVRLYSKANAKDVRLRLPSARCQLLFRNLRDKEAFCGMFQKKPPKEPKEQETPAEGTDDILLIEHHVNGMAGGVPRHIMIQAYYDAQNERIVYDDGESQEMFPVPPHVKKNRNSLIAYLKTQDTSIPYFLLTSV